MSILDSAMERFAGIDSGLVVSARLLQEKPDLIKRILKARAKGNRYFLDHEREGSEFLGRIYQVDFKTALESIAHRCRRSPVPGFQRMKK